ncbi:MAG: hypothetical protein HC942_29015, partial [Microcoleus sp. SU_5_6]|nr:hypothetical protein [Microcoleus sp. SU_5_6]
MGQYQPSLLPIPSTSRVPAMPAPPPSKFERVFQDAAWGAVGGVWCLAA